MVDISATQCVDVFDITSKHTLLIILVIFVKIKTIFQYTFKIFQKKCTLPSCHHKMFVQLHTVSIKILYKNEYTGGKYTAIVVTPQRYQMATVSQEEACPCIHELSRPWSIYVEMVGHS